MLSQPCQRPYFERRGKVIKTSNGKGVRWGLPEIAPLAALQRAIKPENA